MAKRCLGCMKLKEQSPVCEHCGFNENIPNYPHQLPLDTLLRGQYRVGKVLGQGGFGITYMGWDENLDVPIAIKEYFPNGFVNRECTHSLSVTCGDSNRQLFHHNRERFIREAKALAKLRDVPGIVRIHNFFQENDTAYIVMEYVEGIDLKRYIRMRNRVLSAQEALAVLKPVMEALSKVHEAGLVHRDISPDNIMIQPDGSAKLLDFGAVREVLDPDADKQLSQATEAILKQGFAPMEQYQNKGSLGPWTDVYALCATMYYCITGKVPPDAPARLLDGKPLEWNLVPGLSANQIAALERGMAILPRERTASMGQLYHELYSSAQPVYQNYVNSNIQSSQLPNDFRNAYQASAYQPPVTGKAPDPIPNTGRETANSYPNHTVPLDANPISGYQAVPPAKPISGYQPPVTPQQPISGYQPPAAPAQPVTKKKSKKGLILGIAAAAIAAVVAIGSMGGGSGSSKPTGIGSKLPAAEPREKLSQPYAKLEDVMAEGADYTYEYRNGARMELYFDNNDLERCRLYFGEKGQLEYKSVAEYNEYGSIEDHWLYDGNDKLIRRDINTFDKDGNKLTHQLTTALGTVLESTELTYEKGHMTSQIIKDGQGNVKEEWAYGYGKDGKHISSLAIYADGTSAEYTFNDQEKTEAQYNYDKDGNLERYFEYEYDAEGSRASTISYRPDGTVDIYSKSVYNPEGNLVKETWYNTDGTLSYTMTYHRIAGGISMGSCYETAQYLSDTEAVPDITGTYIMGLGYTVSSYSDPPSITTGITTYNDFGDSVKQVSYNEDGSLANTSEYRYDAFGNDLGYTYTSYSKDGTFSVSEYNEKYLNTSWTKYDSSGNLDTWTEYEYNEEDLQIKSTSYKANGFLSSLTELTYENGEVSQRISTYYTENGGYSVTVSDKNYNTLLRTTYDKTEKVIDIDKYEYEWYAEGKPSKAYVYDEDGSLDSWTEYFYDENGNRTGSKYHSA